MGDGGNQALYVFNPTTKTRLGCSRMKSFLVCDGAFGRRRRVPPHPGPLPWGEGASHQSLVDPIRLE